MMARAVALERLADRADRCRPEPVDSVVHDAGHRVAVALRPGGEEAREALAVRLVELADQAQVEQGQLVVGGDEDVPRVQVGVHEAVLEDHLQQRRQPEARHPLRIGAGRRRGEDLRAGR